MRMRMRERERERERSCSVLLVFFFWLLRTFLLLPLFFRFRNKRDFDDRHVRRNVGVFVQDFGFFFFLQSGK